jgi:hypothetical protein
MESHLSRNYWAEEPRHVSRSRHRGVLKAEVRRVEAPPGALAVLVSSFCDCLA